MSGKPFRVLHVTEDHTLRNTGITSQVNAICALLTQAAGPDDAVGLCAVGGGSVGVPDGVRVWEPPLAGLPGRLWRWSPGLTDAIAADIAAYDMRVLHLHGIWLGPQYAGAIAARRAGRPAILTNHGMLTDWAMAQPGRLGALKKRLYLAWAHAGCYRDLAVLHAITPEDRDCLHRLLPGHRVELIPNSVDVARLAAAGGGDAPEPGHFLFVGRLHPKKGVDLLVRAFAAADLPPHCRLTIVGPEEVPSYVAAIRADAERLGVADRVSFQPPIWGDGKLVAMRRAWALCVPSHSEVTGLVNLESAACATPSLTTFGTGLLDWAEGGGVLTQPTVEEIAAALRQAAGWSMDERQARGAASLDLVSRRYDNAVTGPRWIDLYRELSA